MPPEIFYLSYHFCVFDDIINNYVYLCFLFMAFKNCKNTPCYQTKITLLVV